MPKLGQKCISSWKKYCPGYIIKEWNESNFDINCSEYVKEAYRKKKYAFVTDYVRLYAMYYEGGVYMDIDVELVGPLDSFLTFHAFSGFEDDENIPTGIMACEKGFDLFGRFLDYYRNRHFIVGNGYLDLTTNVTTITEMCKEIGFIPNNLEQELEGFKIFPKDYFCPKNHDTGKIEKTKRTVAIHHFSGSWVPGSEKIAGKIENKTKNKGSFLKVTGKILAFPFYFFCKIKTSGIKKSVRFYLNRFRRKG